jgi:chromosome segregation ATPase
VSQTDTQNDRAGVFLKAAKARVETRVDLPHFPANRDIDPTQSGGSDCQPPSFDAETAERIRAQAEQLAEHLRQRQQELDAREAQINARLAQFDSDMRAARLWLTERESQLDYRGEEIAGQEQELKSRLERLAAAKTEQDRQGEAQTQEHTLDGEIRELYEQLVRQRRELQEEARLQQERFELQQRLALEDLEKKRQAIERRAEHADQSRLALRQLRAELAQMHRETLEIRLATEELWARLSGDAPSAALTQSLGRIRAKLSAHYAQAKAELHRQRTELESLRAQLAAQCKKLVQEKRQIEQWSSVQREQSQNQVELLAARERQLQEREAELLQRGRRWQTDRLNYQHEIRRLRSRLSRSMDAA